MIFTGNKAIERYVNRFSDKRSRNGVKIAIAVRRKASKEYPWANIVAHFQTHTIFVKTRSHQRSILWHELGHLHSGANKSLSRAEADAQIWALRKAYSLGFTKLYAELLDDLEDWSEISDDSPPFYAVYAKAQKMVYASMKKEHLPFHSNF